MTNRLPTHARGEDPRYRALLEVVELIGLHTDLGGFLPDLASCFGRIVGFDVMAVVLPREAPDAAVRLGIVRTTLTSTMRRLGIVRPRPQSTTR